MTSLFALADQLEARLSAVQRQVDALTPSLLARAFSGQLVPQDPTDQPASVLFVETLLSLLFGAMAVAVKIAIVQRWQGEAETPLACAVSGAAHEAQSV